MTYWPKFGISSTVCISALISAWPGLLRTDDVDDRFPFGMGFGPYFFDIHYSTRLIDTVKENL